ncbi:MAG: tRNA (adenosine(37)-N6)-dimethylallyltransferase MiaA [Gammaproteobacteria bacterium]|nr:tRNA (adenosine(37)-N6)-dimethylallyltransferase MiaA [Gammaproteobacteria bacterium]
MVASHCSSSATHRGWWSPESSSLQPCFDPNRTPLVLFLMGPTASGKTDLALELVDRYGGEIVSVDSALVYRGMDIGTAKPERSLLQRYPHHLIDRIEPTESYSAAQFREEAIAAIADILARGRLPLLVGGTMLYFRALEQGLSRLPPADPQLRQEIAAEAEVVGWPQLHQTLAELDPQAALRIHPHDPQRISRALEVIRLSGTSLTALQQQQGEPLPWRLLKIALIPQQRQELHRRISDRFAEMLRRGFVEEVEGLRRRGDLHPQLPAMRAVGYRQIWHYLDGGCDRQQMIADSETATRRLGKRQLTWLRSEEGLRSVDPFLKKSRDLFLNGLGKELI